MSAASAEVVDGEVADALVDALCKVPGVGAAGLEPDGKGGWGLLHLDLLPGTDEIGVAAAVGRLLRERFGLGVDTGAIALVEDIHGLAPQGGVGVTSLRVQTAAKEVSARVELAVAGRSAVGESSGTSAGLGAIRAVVDAVGQAVEVLSDGAVEIDVDSVVLGTADAARVVRVVFCIEQGADSRRLVAVGPLTGDPRQAAARAALRVLSDLLA